MARRLDPEGNETRALASLVDFSGRSVVEVGCGDGRVTWRYAPAAARVRAIDPDSEAIARARANTPTELRDRVVFEADDISVVPLAERHYEIALLSRTL